MPAVSTAYRKVPATKMHGIDHVACDVTSDQVVGAAMREVLAKAGRIGYMTFRPYVHSGQVADA